MGWKVLDIGCGTGNRTKTLATLVGESGKVIAIDPIEKRIAEARKHHNAENIEYYVASGESSNDFGDDFDLVVAATVLHWIPFDKQKELFCKVRSCLKNGGYFIFNSMIQEGLNFMKFLPFLSDQELANQIRRTLHCRNS